MPVFPKTLELTAKLPPVKQVNHEIDLETGSKPPSRAPYRLSQPQLDELQAQLTVLLKKKKRLINEPSKSPFGAPVFFVKKSESSLRLVCDWRELNRITIRNEACLPSTDDCLIPYKEASSSLSWIYTLDIIRRVFESQTFQRRLSTLSSDIFSTR